MAHQEVNRSPLLKVITLGYCSIVVLAVALPFNASHWEILRIGTLHISNVTLLICAVSLIAAATIIVYGIDPSLRSKRVEGVAWGSRPFGIIIALFLLLVLASLLSSLNAGLLREEPTWMFGILAGALVWLAVPIWLSEAPQKRADAIGNAFVVGAVVAALLGLAEFKLGHEIEALLVPFRPGPTLVGSYLRLSGPFGHANEAAMYFCLALPFAINRLYGAAGQIKTSWVAFMIWLAATDILLIALLLTYSRGGIVALAIALLSMTLAARKQLGLTRVVMSRKAVGLALNCAVLVVLFVASTASIDAMRLSGQSDTGWYRVSFQSSGLSKMRAGSFRSVRVGILNRGPAPWRLLHRDDYAVGYHWLHSSWSVARFDNPTTPLKSSVPAGGKTDVLVALAAPSRPGRYLLVWDLLYRGTTWFAERTGAFSAVEVMVSSAARGPGAGASAPLGPDKYHPWRLPVAQTASRSQIWRVALHMIEAGPLLGLGPYGFRTDYYRFLHRDPLRRAPPPSNAHNLVIELLADYGILGAVLFLALIIVLWWPTLSRGWQGGLTPGTSLAVLGAGAAFAAQGTVEYFLGTLSILFAFWLLCGLAQSPAVTRGL